MKKAKDIMSKNLHTCFSHQTVKEAAALMTSSGHSVIPVVDNNGALLGIVTESDFVGKEVKVPHALASIKQLFGEVFYFSDVETMYKNAQGKKLSEVMSQNIQTIGPEASLNDIVNFMISKDLKRLPVVDKGKLVGIITRKDILKAFSAAS